MKKPKGTLFITLMLFTYGLSLAYETPFETEYQNLYQITDDKFGLESIRVLHKQLDDDNDGTIEPSETKDFIKADLQKDSHQQQVRQKRFHGKDVEITVKDLWNTWWKSEVHNWTVDQTVHWLINNVELPQYEPNFRRHSVDGAKLPQVAVGSSYLSKVVGISNAIHRSKITLKAMDVVLFGPPKETLTSWKDTILTSLLIVALSCLLYAFRQNKMSQAHLKRMSSDMEGLSKAEEELQNLQAKYQQRQQSQHSSDASDVIEVSKLKEEVEVLRNELQRAEIELEDRCWIAPPVLQHWLQLTYELESQVYNAKKKSAEEQLENAKDLCEKLKKKRSSLVGAFVSTHGCSIDEVDKSILEAKMALLEVTQDLAERTQRWRQIEALCGCPIVSNPGLGQLKNMVRHVGGLGRPAGRIADISNEENLSSGQEDDSRSVVGSSLIASRVTASTTLSAIKALKNEEDKDLKFAVRIPSSSNLSAMVNGRASPVQGKSSSMGTAGNRKIGPGGKRMIKSLSHGAGSSMGSLAALLASKEAQKQSHQKVGITSSVSDTHLQSRNSSEVDKDVKNWIIEASGEDLSSSKPVLDDSPDGSRPVLDDSADSSNPEGPEETQETEESSSDHDSGGSEKNKKSRKIKKFFNFGRKKERVV